MCIVSFEFVSVQESNLSSEEIFLRFCLAYNDQVSLTGSDMSSIEAYERRTSLDFILVSVLKSL